MTIESLFDDTEETRLAAYRAGKDFYTRNRPADGADVGFAARSTGWHGAHEWFWIAGYFRAKANALGF